MSIQKFIIYGAGTEGRIAKLKMEYDKEDVICFIDQNLQGQKVEGLDVLSIDEGVRLADKFNYKIVISSQKHKKTMKHTLKMHGFKNYQVFSYNTLFEAVKYSLSPRWKINKRRYIKIVEFLYPVFLVLFFPFALMLYILNFRLVYNFRFPGFGHMALEPDALLANDDFKKYKFIAIVDETNTSNRYLLDIVTSKFITIKNFYLFHLFYFMFHYKFLNYNAGNNFMKMVDKYFLVEDNNIMEKTDLNVLKYMPSVYRPLVNNEEQNFFFPEGEKENCREILDKSFGIKENDWFVCVHARDDREYNQIRSCNIHSFEQAIEFITSKGGFVIRLGDKGVQKLSYNNSKVIDYANSNVKSKIMDLYLMSEQTFLIGTITGVSDVSQMFRRPVISTNVASWVQPRYMKGDIYLLKMFKNKVNDLIIGISEYMDNKIYLSAIRDEIEILNKYQVLDNTAEEILNATKEMYAVLFENKQPFNFADQDQYRKKFPEDSMPRIGKANVSQYFLDKYKNIFGI
ncbi:TIGR04372 family glycosyltransferase [Sulfurimonas sp. HSL-1716]|uniref:TIGR04372 family glycosyltransferase n=1 Tax=Hydrocurvibacter sulfurireducens TaxID=3131937 RepID=UPI0031F9D64D